MLQNEMRSSFLNVGFIGFILALLSGCINRNEVRSPLLETMPVTEITETTAKSGGKIIADNNSEVTSKGICWDQADNPTLNDEYIEEGPGDGAFESVMIDLMPAHDYYVRAYAVNNAGISYGDVRSFRTLAINTSGQIIADHSVIDKYDDIPQYYIDKVKEMWLVYAGESHSAAIRTGMTLLEALNPVYQVSVTESGTPESYSTEHLRVSRGTWGDVTNSTGWIYTYGEEDWFTNSNGISRTKAGITYCNTNNLAISAIGFGWCWDDTYGKLGRSADPVFGVRWSGVTDGGPEGSRSWGLDAGDYSITGNSVCMDTYLRATQEYIDYCSANSYLTRVFFTTGPVDTYYDSGEVGYQGSLKHQYIRDYVRKDSSRILFDYADILCYDDNGVRTMVTWNGHTFPRITPTNGTPEHTGHISNAGAIRLAKAMWWMLARIAGWNGE